MTWMLTAQGQRVDLRCIALETIRIQDVAHHLALVNRWSGATRRPYSVAEHSLLVAEILEREHGITSPGVLMAGLMHDAHEAYCGDLSTPMKQLIGERWHDEEARIQRALWRRFDIDLFAWTMPLVKQADLQALATEWRDLIGLAQLMPPDLPPPIAWLDLRQRAAMEWTDWRQAFLDRFTELAYARALAVADAAGAPAPELYEGPHA